MNHRELKAWLPHYLAVIGVEFKSTHDGNKLLCACPVHDEKTPSFTAEMQNGAFVCHCFGCNFGGTVIDLHARLNGFTLPADFNATCESLAAKMGERYEERDHHATRAPKAAPASTGPVLPKDATAGTVDDWRAIAASRNVSLIAVATAAKHLGTLRVGTVCGFRSWIITDRQQANAEARRIDRKPYPAFGDIGERKAHTLRGSNKSWPVGLKIERHSVRDFRAVLAVEGGPDYLAALHFTLHAKADCLPVAFLGAGAAGKIHPTALELLIGKRVRFYQHADDKGQGAAAVSRWANQLAAVCSYVDAVTFDGLRQADGSPVKDLNDCTNIHADDAGKLGEVLP